MAKSSVKEKSGPFLAAAFCCEQTLEDKDGTISAIRIVDRFTITLPASVPANYPSKTHRLPVSFNALVSFKTGDSPGTHTVRCEMVSPSGKVNERAFVQTFAFLEQYTGSVNVRMPIAVGVKQGGLFKMNVYLDDRFMTQVPFEIILERSQVEAETKMTPIAEVVTPAQEAEPKRLRRKVLRDFKRREV